MQTTVPSKPCKTAPTIGELLSGGAAKVAQAVYPKPAQILTEFKPELETCVTHGSYALNMRDESGHVRRNMEGCPTCRKQKNAHRLLAVSNIPKRFEACDFGNYTVDGEAQKRVFDTCVAYAENFAKHRETGACLTLCGTPGTGKNHLATAISKRVLALGFTVLRVKASEYLDAYWGKSFDERDAWLKGMAGVDLLMIDEVGRASNAKSAQDAFFRLLDERYEAQLPTLMATNLNRKDLIEVLGDASFDRLTQGGGARLTLNWPSHRATVGVSA